MSVGVMCTSRIKRHLCKLTVIFRWEIKKKKDNNKKTDYLNFREHFKKDCTEYESECLCNSDQHKQRWQ